MKSVFLLEREERYGCSELLGVFGSRDGALKHLQEIFSSDMRTLSYKWKWFDNLLMGLWCEYDGSWRHEYNISITPCEVVE